MFIFGVQPSANMSSVSNQDADVCCICLDGYHEDTHLTYFACGHKMHTGCYRDYIKVNMLTCPLCRHPILADPSLETCRSFQPATNMVPVVVELPQVALQAQRLVVEHRALVQYRNAMMCSMILFLLVVGAILAIVVFTYT